MRTSELRALRAHVLALCNRVEAGDAEARQALEQLEAVHPSAVGRIRQARGVRLRRPFDLPDGVRLHLQRDWINCGQSRCPTCHGLLYAHGPYYYVRWGRHGRRYLGRTIPSELHDRLTRARRRLAPATAARRP